MKNLDSIQDTYPEINVYHRVIMQYVDETNMKYGLNLTFTRLACPGGRSYGQKLFNVVGYEEGPSAAQ